MRVVIAGMWIAVSVSVTPRSSGMRFRNAVRPRSVKCLVTQRPTSVAPAISVVSGFCSYQLANWFNDVGGSAPELALPPGIFLAKRIGGASYMCFGIGALCAALAARIMGA